MASSKGTSSTKRTSPKIPHTSQPPRKPPASIRPLPPYSSGEPTLDAVLLPLLSDSEPGKERERAHALEQARTRLLDHSQPTDAPHLIALLNEEVLTLGDLPLPSHSSPPQSQQQRLKLARLEQTRADRLSYLAVLFAAACLHAPAQKHLATILSAPYSALIKERLALQITATHVPLLTPLRKALFKALKLSPPDPSPEERNFISSIARSLQTHIPPEEFFTALQPLFEPKEIATLRGALRAQMILTDLDTTQLASAWRPILGSLLRSATVAQAACDLLMNLPPSPDDSVFAAAALEEHLDQGYPPDGALLSLIARAPHPEAVKTLLRALDAELEPDWQTILSGIKRTKNTLAAEPLLHWIERHKKRTEHLDSWDGYTAARNLVHSLIPPR